jgi:hypothetical protein
MGQHMLGGGPGRTRGDSQERIDPPLIFQISQRDRVCSPVPDRMASCLRTRNAFDRSQLIKRGKVRIVQSNRQLSCHAFILPPHDAGEKELAGSAVAKGLGLDGEIVVDHALHELIKADFPLPPQLGLSFRRVTD